MMRFFEVLRKFLRPYERHIFCLALLTLNSWGSISAAPLLPPVPKANASATLDLKKAFPSSNARLLGLRDQNTALFVLTDPNVRNQGKVVCWDIQTSKAVGSVPLSAWISGFNLRLSPDGRYLASTNVPSAREFKDVKVYRISVLSSSSLRVVATYDLPEKEDCSGVLFVPGQTDKVIFKMRSLVPYEDTYVYGNNRLDIFDIKTKKTIRSIAYHPSFEADKIVPSADGKFWVVVYYSLFFNNFGENGLTEEQDKGATLDVIDWYTGNIKWHVLSTPSLSVGDPVFFISPREFVSSRSTFDLVRRVSRRWALSAPLIAPISEVPGKAQFVVVGTKTGFKIRNWKRGRDVKAWQIKGSFGRAFFSPDLKTIAYRQTDRLSFLRFDPRLLKP